VFLHLFIALNEMLPPDVVVVGDGIVLIAEVHAPVEILLDPAVDDRLDLLNRLHEVVIARHHLVARQQLVGFVELDGLPAVGV
jgi:hypothetical protein